MNRSILKTTLILVTFLLFSTLHAQADLASQIDDIVQSTYSDELPGASFMVVKDGEVIYSGAKGMANVELGVPLNQSTVFRIGSITKQFTAASILLLEERGKLSIEDTIDIYLPDYPVEYASKITIHHLLSHTSGIISYTGIPGYMNSAKIRRDLSTSDLVDVFKDLAPFSVPGDKWLYNNSGYVLLGAIIESVSGRTYEEFVNENIFAKLEMDNSYYGKHNVIIPNRASGYQVMNDHVENAPFLSMTQPHAAGSLLSTVEDLAKWDRALFSGEVLSEESFRKMTTPGMLNDGQMHTYGYGFIIGETNGMKVVSHGGGIFGFATAGIHVVEANLFVAVFSNGPSREMNPNDVALKIVNLALQ